jgi:protein SCO1/2
MNTMTRRAWFAAAAAVPVAGVLLGAKARSGSARRTGRFGPGYFPNVVLHTHEGKRVRFYDDLLKGKIVLVNFMYSVCRGVCPAVTTNLLKVHKLLGDRVGRDIFIYSVTLKPDEDTPSVLKRYAEARGVGPGWLLLTGDADDLELVRHKLGAVDPDPAVDADKSQHTGMIRYGNEPLERWAACPGASNPKWIVESVLWAEGPRAPA